MDKIEVIRILDEAKRIIVEKGWAQGYYARDEQGGTVEATDGAACSFCIAGAVSRAYAGCPWRIRVAVFGALTEVTPGGNVAIYNDAPGRTKEEVVALFDKAKGRVNEQG